MSDLSNTVVEGFDPAILANVFQLRTDQAQGLTSAFFFAFNTTVSVVALGSEELCTAAFRDVNDECKRYERLFSRHIPESDIARLNNAQGNEIEIDEETYALLQASRHYCAISRGAFDISVGSALRLWDFAREVIPESQELARSTSHIDWRMLRLRSNFEETGGSAEENACFDISLSAEVSDGRPPKQGSRYYARLSDPEGAIDVGGIAKGYIADKLASRLQSYSMDSYIINLGGNVVVKGRRPDGRPWKVGLQDPQGRRPSLRAIDVVDASAVTSGTYQRSFSKDGVLYHHILDPRTGRPVNTDAAGVTVVASKSLDAEGFSTTLLALGIEEGRSFVREHDEIIAAYFIDEEGTVTQV